METERIENLSFVVRAIILPIKLRKPTRMTKPVSENRTVSNVTLLCYYFSRLPGTWEWELDILVGG